MAYEKTYLPTLKTHVVNLRRDAKDLSRDLQRLEVRGKLGSKTFCQPIRVRGIIVKYPYIILYNDIFYQYLALFCQTNKYIRAVAVVSLFCQTLIEPREEGMKLNRDHISCKITYTANGKTMLLSLSVKWYKYSQVGKSAS